EKEIWRDISPEDIEEDLKLLEEATISAENKKEVKEKLENKIVLGTHTLRERIKELTCLYGFSQLAGKVGISMQDLLKELLQQKMHIVVCGVD
ncbi:hypothetical protein LCGC14_2981480, partial [marine sediment metagenome]